MEEQVVTQEKPSVEVRTTPPEGEFKPVPEGMTPVPPKQPEKDEVEKYIMELAKSTLMFFNIVNASMIRLGYSRKERKRMFEDFRDFGVVDGRLHEAMKTLVKPLIKVDTNAKVEPKAN